VGVAGGVENAEESVEPYINAGGLYEGCIVGLEGEVARADNCAQIYV